MAKPERSVVHVLPHAGGGGDTYVDLLADMPGYRMHRVYLAPQRKPGARTVVAGLRDLSRNLRGHDVVHVHGEGTAALLLPLLALRPSVVTLHGLHLWRRAQGLARDAAALNLRAVVRAASRTICVSLAERDQLEAVVGAEGEHGVVVVHNGVRVFPAAAASSRAAVRRELGLEESETVAIWVGSLDERRDPVVVVRAAQSTSTALLFVGEGPLRSPVERLARPPVHVLGQRVDVPRLLGGADFFVLMSAREGFSFALLEAMAHGLPAIVADIPENVEAIGDAGIAVPYGDEPEVTAAFRSLGDATLRAELGKRARTRISQQFTADAMIAKTKAVYDEVVASV
jgi:glycosyltransferase involved in cell wall biosynthesis